MDEMTKLKETPLNNKDEDEVREHNNKVINTEVKLTKALAEVQKAKLDLEFEERTRQRKEKVLKKRAEIDKLMIGEDKDDLNSSQDLRDDADNISVVSEGTVLRN